MESEEQKWLRKHYHPAPSDSPAAKRTKFSDIQQQLTSKFPNKTFNSTNVSATIKSAFPHALSKPVGRSRQKYVFGLEKAAEADDSFTLDEKQQLLDQIRVLEERVEQLEKEKSSSSSSQLSCEFLSLLKPEHAVYHGPDNIIHFKSFNVDTVIAEMHDFAPNLYGLLKSMGKGTSTNDGTQLEDVRVATSLSILLKSRSVKVLGVQLLITLMLLARSTNRQAITVLNHAGVCVSYQTAWKYLQQLTTEARYHEIVQSGHWQWVFDNLNMNQRVRHEREDRHSTMMNITARLAIRLRHLPDWHFDWSDTQPQCSRETLTISNFLPSEADAAELKTRATHYLMRFLTQEFTALAELKKHAPEQRPIHPPTKTEVAPMKVLFKDEKYTSETIDILAKLMEDGNLKGTCQMVVGDQLTCKNMRSSKRWRQPEVNIEDRLTWVKEVPGDFHFLWECLRVVFMIFWGTPAQPGSLCNLRELIRRVQVDKGVKVLSVGDEFILHAFRAHLTTGILTQLKLKGTSDPIQHTDTKEWLQHTAECLVTTLLMPQKSDDPVYHLHSSFLHHAFLYIDLRDAIRWENGPEIIRHWKWWLPRFLATGRKQYAAESVYQTCNLCANFPRHMAYIAIHNRTVNMSGKPGHGKPVDQLIEHYNLVFKQTLRSAGGTLTVKHVEDVSMCVLFLLEAAKKTDRAFRATSQTTAHTVRSSCRDIHIMVQHLQEQKVTERITGRHTPVFTDPAEQGWQKLSTTSWLQDRLSSMHHQDEEEETLEMGEVDFDYELFLD